MNSKLLFALIPLFAVCESYGQGNGYQTNKIIPPAPTAAALGKYGDVPISFYNGTPNISIPIYNIKTTNHDLKIALNYDASGTKVSQDASWVGLGWSLSAGGVITRTVRQLDDFSERGYYRVEAIPDSTSQSTTASYAYYKSIYDGSRDAEPDVFSYNFNGLSGRFVLGKMAEGSLLYLDEKNDLRIQYNLVEAKWTITTGDGYKYIFNVLETVQNYSANTMVDINVTGVQNLSLDLEPPSISAWYLSSIEAPSGETVNFSYINGKSLGLVSKSEYYYKLLGFSSTDHPACSPEVADGIHDFMTSRQAVTEAYLKTITFSTGSIEFNTSPRSDIEYLNTYPNLILPSKLDAIIIKDPGGAQLKKYSFNYSYFHIPNSNQDDYTARLKLDAMTEYGSDNTSARPYVFTYRNPNSLPNKNSKSLDHWGFYNGITNYSLLPANIITQTVNFVPANKEPDEVEAFPANGVLTNLKYPTGGTTTFDYELHDYSNLKGEAQYKLIDKFHSVSSNPNDPNSVAYKTFTIPATAIVDSDGNVSATISYSYSKINNSANDVPSLGYSNMRKLNDNNTTTAIAGGTTAAYNGTNPGQEIIYKALKPGNYEMEVLSNQNYSFYMSISWKEKETVPLQKRKGGGIRIRKITNEDGLGHTSVKRYLYTDDLGKSTGKLLTYPVYGVNFYTPLIVKITQSPFGVDGAVACSTIGRYTQVSSNTLFPSGLSSKSGIIGYSKVIELDGENGENGKTEYFFHNQEEIRSDFPGIPIVADPLNSKLDSVKYYNGQNLVVKKDSYEYIAKEVNTLQGIKLFSNVTFARQANQYNVYNFYHKYYVVNSHWTVNSRKSETIYSGIVGNTTTTDYAFDSNVHRAPTQLTVAKSDGNLLRTEYKRASDYTANQGSVANQMTSDNVIAPVIEEKTFLTQGTSLKLISGVFNEYQRYNNKFYRPFKVYQYEATPPYNNPTQPNGWFDGLVSVDPSYRLILTNDLYDLTSGNLLTRHYTNAPYETFVWGYNKQYPVARIIGVDYTTINSLVNSALLNNLSATNSQIMTELNNLRVSIANEKREISTYTYSPSVGLTSNSDSKALTTYYEYDNFQRLKNIKDKDGNIVKHLKYNYRP